MKRMRGFQERFKNVLLVLGGFFVVLFGVSKVPLFGSGSHSQSLGVSDESTVHADAPYAEGSYGDSADSGVGGDSGDSGGSGDSGK